MFQSLKKQKNRCFWQFSVMSWNTLFCRYKKLIVFSIHFFWGFLTFLFEFVRFSPSPIFSKPICTKVLLLLLLCDILYVGVYVLIVVEGKNRNLHFPLSSFLFFIERSRKHVFITNCCEVSTHKQPCLCRRCDKKTGKSLTEQIKW